jgi:hypothetical protein
MPNSGRLMIPPIKKMANENPPLRLFLGKLAYPWTQYTYGQKLALWDEWKDVSIKLHGH